VHAIRRQCHKKNWGLQVPYMAPYLMNHYLRNLTPREIKKYYLCFIYFNNLVKYFSGARLRRCLISSKTVEISREKFHEIRKTNNAHDVTMTSKRIDFVGSKF
jgi:ABC-type transporter MlaC component